MKCRSRAILSLVLCAMLLLICPFARAAETVDLDASCTLTIQFSHQEKAVSGAVFQLYRVADVNASMKFAAAAPFTSVAADAAALAESALQLSAQAQSLNAPVVHTLTTDEKGTATVSNLRPGAWLLVGQPTESEDSVYYVDPQVVILPGETAEGDLNYSVTVLPKSTQLSTNDELVDRTVVKVWSDQGYESQRPRSITVRLLRDGKVIDRVELSSVNNWRYTWNELLPNANWTVEEDVPENYVSELQESDGVFTLTNHRKDIPQTGHIWWPVLLVVAVGFLFVVAGVLLRRSGRHEA